MPYENSDDAERYSDVEEREQTEDPEQEEFHEDFEREAQEHSDSLRRRETADKLAEEASDELDEVESRERDDSQRNDFNRERSMEDDLSHDLDEMRDDLHDRFVNDMERQFEGASTKEVEENEPDPDGSYSEMIESSESYHDAGDGMVYATRTMSGSIEAEAAEIETEEETKEVSEPENQEFLEQQVESEKTEEPANEKETNQIVQYESEQAETAASSETQEILEYNDARTHPEVSEKEKGQEVSEPEPSVSSKDRYDSGELSKSVEDTGEGEVSETSDPNPDIEDLEQDINDILESYRPETEPVPSYESEEESIKHGESEQDVSEGAEVESEEDEVSEIPAEDESLPETIDEFVERVRKLLDERTEEDDSYDYVQDPLTGEIQRVPKILAEYESDEQRQRRKNRNLFAELSGEERERFKELVCEKDRSAEVVEKAWDRVVEQAERKREEMFKRVRRVLADPEVRQLLEDMAEEDNRRTTVEYAEDDEVKEDKQFLTQGESRLKLWIPQVNSERVESVEQLEELVRERYPGLMKHKDYPKYLRQAKLHLELVQRFQKENLKRGDIARIARETREPPVTVKRWLIEGAKPRIYHYLNRNPLDDRAERVAKLLSSLNGVTDIEILERRLKTLFLYEVWQGSKHHTKRFKRARLFFEFLEEYAKGGILKNIAKHMRIGKSTISEWFSGSQLPFYIRLAVTVPEKLPEPGKKWLPLRLNSRTNLPERFIQVPEEVTSEEDLLSVLRQLQSLRTPEMREFEEKYGKQSKALAFMYLLGLIVSDGGFDSDSDLSARVVLYASKKYRWNLRLGKAFSYAMGKVGLNVERRADSTKIRDGKTTVFSVWGSQASPLLRWMKKVLFGLGPSLMKKKSPIHADWILNLNHDYRAAFLQGLADGDGYASIRSFNAGIATLTNHTFLNKILNTFNIFPTIEKTKVRIGRYDNIVKASELPLFKHATGRQEQLEELSKLIDSLDSNYGRVPKDEIEIIMEMHVQGMSCGEITESLWIHHGIARSRRSVEGIVKRRK